jgi:hypothetical protein
MTSTYDSTGVILDRYADVLARLITLLTNQFGESINTAEDTYIGNEIRNISDEVAAINEIVQATNDGFSIANSIGSALDNLLAIVGVERTEASFSTVTLTLTAIDATTVPAGSKYKTATNVIFETDTALTFTGAGSDTVAATCTVVGENNAAIGEVNLIVDEIYGITTVTNAAAAIPGRLRATDEEMKTRHTTAVQTSGENSVNAISEAVAGVTGVSAVYTDDNRTNETVDGVPAHNVVVSVIGGSDADVAAAIDTNITEGVPTFGSTTVSVYNETISQSKDINFSRASNVPLHIALSITTTPGVFPDDGADTIKDALVAEIATYGISTDVIYDALKAQIYSVPGFVLSSYFLDTVDPPTGTADIPMSILQRATLAKTDIDITVS